MNVRLGAYLLALGLPFSHTSLNAQQAASAPTPAAPVAASSQPRWVSVAEAVKAPVGSTVYLRGRLTSVVPPRPGSKQPYSLYIKEGSNLVRIVMFQEMWEQVPDKSFLQPGYVIDVYGEGGKFEGTSQLVVKGGKHIRQAPGTKAPSPEEVAALKTAEEQISLSQVTPEKMGQIVTVTARVETITSPTSDRAPWRFDLSDGTGKMQVVCWNQVLEKVPADQRFGVGDTIQVTALVCEFKNVLQLRVDDPSGWRKGSVDAEVAAGQ